MNGQEHDTINAWVASIDRRLGDAQTENIRRHQELLDQIDEWGNRFELKRQDDMATLRGDLAAGLADLRGDIQPALNVVAGFRQANKARRFLIPGSGAAMVALAVAWVKDVFR